MKTKKIVIRGKAKIYETDENKIVIKSKKKELTSLFEYLNTRDFNNYPKILEENNNEIRYSYYTERQIMNEESIKDEELIKTIGSLHYKTTYFKPVSKKKYKEIYNTLIDNIDYLKDYYDKLIRKIDTERYMSPSHYLLARNYTLINSNLIYIEKELNAWFNLVKDKTKERVSIVHNNLKKDNFIRGEENVLISWDNYLVDTPILDIYKLYKNEYKNMDFTSLLKTYNEIYPLTKEEIKLFMIMISMPKKLETKINEYENVLETSTLIDYTYRTNGVVSSGIFN